MIRKVPIIGPLATLGDIAYAISRSKDVDLRSRFKSAMLAFAGSRHIYLTNSGISAFYIILTALSALSQKTEVVLPAYTAGSLVVAVRKAGLRPVLCDISLEDFNADLDSMAGAVNDRTLAVVPVHMFGIGMAGIAGLKQRLGEGVFVIEDCCQAMGSSVAGSKVGNFGDVSFFSFNRGKNLPACGGGCIATNNETISKAIAGVMERIPARGPRIDAVPFFKAALFLLAAKPFIYALAYPMARLFKETKPPEDFEAGEMSIFHDALAMGLLKRFEASAQRRYNNGMSLLKGLGGIKDLTVPPIRQGDMAVFNRLPVLFKDASAVCLASGRLWAYGIEASRMYIRPLHLMFDLGYGEDEFPNASYFAPRVLTLPVYSVLSPGRISGIVSIIKEVCA